MQSIPPSALLSSICSARIMHWVFLCLFSASAWLAKLADAGTSALVKGCASGSAPVCDPTLLFLLNESMWSGELVLSYEIEAGVALRAALFWMNYIKGFAEGGTHTRASSGMLCRSCDLGRPRQRMDAHHRPTDLPVRDRTICGQNQWAFCPTTVLWTPCKMWGNHGSRCIAS